LIVIQNGSTLAGQAWYNTATIVTVDTTAFNFVRFGTTGTITSISASTGITLTPNPIVSTGTVATTAITQVVIQTFAANGTYTPTTGMKYCTVEIVGGGGGSGGTAGTAGQSASSSSGGGGGYCRKTYTAANIGASAAVVIGAGGTAGASGNNTGGTGVSSTFTPAGTGATLTATGGTGGQGSNSSATFVSSGNTGVGGTGTNGDVNIRGGWGSQGFVINGATATLIQSAGGTTPLGPNSQASPPLYGVGGPGATNSGANAAGLAGGTGFCYVTEYVNA
jgi:hypothetical protein